MRRSRWWLALAAIAALALLLRIVHLGALNATPVFAVLLGDSREYDRWAAEIANGAWLGTGVFYQAPLYPYVLAIVYSLFGQDPGIVRVVQAIAGAASCVLLGLAGRQFFGASAGLIAAALLAIYPPAIFFDSLIQKSSLDLLLMSALLACVARVDKPPASWLLVGAGAALGALTLNRENAALLFPVLAVWIWSRTKPEPARTRLAQTAIFTAGVAIMVMPVGMRNYAAGGEFVLTTSQLGPNFYIGNHAGAGGSYESLVEGRGDPAYERADATRLAEEASARRLSPREVSRYWQSRAWSDILADPGRWLRLMGRKLLLTINAHEAVDTESIAVHASYSPVLRVLRWFDFGVLLPLSVIGAWLTRGAWRKLGVLYLMFAALALATATFYVVARYRFPLVPIAVLFAGAGLSIVGRATAWRAENRRGLPTAIAVGAMAAILARLPVTPASHDDTRLNIATELVRLDRPAAAIPLFEQAIAESPNYPLSHYELGRALLKLGERRRAIEAFRTTISLQPEHAEARMALASLLLEAGNAGEALEHMTHAVRHRPDDFAVRLNLGSMLLTMSRAPEAVPHLEHALGIMPDSVPEAISALSLLAEAYRGAGRRDDAIATLEKALAVARAARLDDAVRRIETAIASWRRGNESR